MQDMFIITFIVNINFEVCIASHCQLVVRGFKTPLNTSIMMIRSMKDVQPDGDSNLGTLAYMSHALKTGLPEPLKHLLSRQRLDSYRDSSVH